MRNMRWAGAVVVAAVWLGGCDIFKQDGHLDLQLTDSPYTDASQVNVTITGVELKSDEDGWQSFDFNPAPRINLLDLQRGLTRSLLSDERLPSGDYTAIRLLLRTSKTSAVDSSFVNGSGVVFPLFVADNDDDELLLEQNFSIDDHGTTALTLDVDLRRGLLAPDNDVARNAYRLTSALRLVEDDDAGTINGTVSAPRLSPSGCVPAVYAYPDDVASDDMDDIGGTKTEPVVTAPVASNASYVFAFMPEGRYTLGYTCDAAADDPEDDDELKFIVSKQVDVKAGKTTTVTPF